MAPVVAFDRLVCRNFVTGPHCFRHYARKVIDNESRMRLARRDEILFDAQMDLQISAFKPTASARSKLRRLHLFREPEDAMVERPRIVFPPGRHRNQNVIDTLNRHSIPRRLSVGMASKPRANMADSYAPTVPPFSRAWCRRVSCLSTHHWGQCAGRLDTSRSCSHENGSSLELILCLLVVVTGYLLSASIGFLGLAQRGLLKRAGVLPLTPLHWLLLSIAAWWAAVELIYAPFR